MAEILFAPSGSEATDRKIRRGYENGKLVRIVSGIYVEPGSEPVEAVVV